MKRQAVTTLHQCPSLRYLKQVVSHHKDRPETEVYAASSPPSRPHAGVNGVVLFTRSTQRPKASPLSAQQKTFRHFLRQVKKEIAEASGDKQPDFTALDALIASSRIGLPNIGQLSSPVHDLRRFVKSLDSRAEPDVPDADPRSDPHATDGGRVPADAVIEQHFPIAPALDLLATGEPLTDMFPPSELFQLFENLGRRENRARLVVIFLEQLARPTRHLSLVRVSAHALDQSMKDGTFAEFARRREGMKPAIEKITLPVQLETCPPCLSFFDKVSTIRFPRPEMSTLDLTHLPTLKMIKLYAPLNEDLGRHTRRPADCHVRTILED